MIIPVLAVLLVSFQQDGRIPTPIRQSSGAGTARVPLTIEDVSRNDRWLGLGVRDVRWAPDGSGVYFRWNIKPKSAELPEADPWFRTDAAGQWAEPVPAGAAALVPGASLVWSRSGRLATWAEGSSLYLFDGAATRRIATLAGPIARPRFARADGAVEFEVGEGLYRYGVTGGGIELVAIRVVPDHPAPTDAARQLARQQRDLFPSVRQADRDRELRAALARGKPGTPFAIPVPAGTKVDRIELSPDGRYLTFRATTTDLRRPPTKYLDFVDPSGYSKVLDARSKTGEPRDLIRLGVVAAVPTVPADSLEVRWITLPEASDERTEPAGLFWNLEGTRAVAQFVGEHDHDLWIAEIDPTSGKTRVLTHDHDEGWLGGPPIQSNYVQAALLEWLPGNRFVFASERSGWSHLYLAEPDGSVRPLTTGEWEVREASLSRDRTQWLLQTSQEHPSDDQLAVMPAAGGPLRPLTRGAGRNGGVLSPDGTRVAITNSTTSQLPDLFLRATAGSDPARRVTMSGTDEFTRHRLVNPEIVSFAHPDGKPVWAALYRPAQPNRERAAVIHFHGGGYRQFAHRGWSVYGWGLHVGFLHYLLQSGYTVLDFDYRGGAGFGKAYRTDVTGAMGITDVDGAVAAARYLVRTQGIDSTRIGVYGVSYGGFMTLMSQFRYPGIFAAGIARASVTDYAHYSDEWTSRILGLPQRDTAAYRRSSPIYYAEGLKDHLLVEHGLVDDNVHFQDAARLVQRLVELGKDFEVMYYPSEPHTVQTEASRLDQSKRAIRFFDRYLRGRGRPDER